MHTTALVQQQHHFKFFGLGLFLLLGIFLTSCSSGPLSYFFNSNENCQNSLRGAQSGGSLLLAENAEAGDALADLLQNRLGTASGVLAASFVDMGNFERSSQFGRLCAQQVGSRLSQRGFKVLESRLGAELRMGKDGEFMLTRESARLLAREHNANSVLLGAYTESRQRVFVSARVVRLNDNAVIAAHEYHLPKNADVLALMSVTPGRAQAPEQQAWAGFAAREMAFPPK